MSTGRSSVEERQYIRHRPRAAHVIKLAPEPVTGARGVIVLTAAGGAARALRQEQGAGRKVRPLL